MGRGGLEGGDDALVVVVGILGDLGIPHHLLGEHGLPVDDGGHLPVASAGVEADAAAVHVAAHGLGLADLGGDGVAVHHLEGLLIDVGHEILVEGAGAALGVGSVDGLIDGLVAGQVDLEAALEPQQGLDDSVHIVEVGLGHVGGAVDKGLVHGHLTAGALHGDIQGLLGVFQEGLIEGKERNVVGVQLGEMLDGYVNTKVFHRVSSSLTIRSGGLWASRLKPPPYKATSFFSSVKA